MQILTVTWILKNKNIYNHNHLMSGYYLDCLDEK